MSNIGSSFDILPPNEQSTTVYGELNLNIGQLITSSFNVAFVRLIVKFWGQSKGIIMISSNGDPTGNLSNQQKYLIKTSLPMFKKYLQDGYLMIEVVDKRNANLIGSCQSTKQDTLLDFNQDFMVYRNNASVELSTIGTLKIGSVCTFFIFPPDLSPIKQKKSILPPKFEHAIDDSDEQPQSNNDIDHLPSYQEARQIKKAPLVEQKIVEKGYINSQEQLELELLRLEDDAALLFGITKPSPQYQNYNQIPATIHEIETQHHHNFSYRDVSSLTIQIIKFTMISEKQRKTIGDRPVVVECRVPVLKTGVVSNQSFEVWDSDRSGQTLYFGGQFQSPLQVNEQNWSQINQFQIKFTVQTPQDLPAPIEIGLGEFQLQQMLIDGLRSFTYDTDITQLRLDKKKTEKVKVGILSIKISLGPGEQQQIVKQKKTEDEIDLLRKDLQAQIQQYKQELETAKQQTQINLADELQNMQLFLYIDRVQEMSQTNLWNLQIKCKPYGLGNVEKLESDIRWRKNRPYFGLKLINPINKEIIQKMEFLQWVIEIWNHSPDQQTQLIGICKLSLQQVHSGVFTSASPITYIQYLKTNLHPLVVYDSDMPIEDLRDRFVIGVINLKLAFGTPQQIIRYENQINKHQIEDESEGTQSQEQPEEEHPTEEIEQPVEQPQEKETTEEFAQQYNMRLIQALIIVLNQIIERPVHIPLIPKKSFIPRELCQTLLQQLTSKMVYPIALEVITYNLYDPIQQLVNWGHFLDSWVAFQSYRNWTKDELTQVYQAFYSQAIRSGAFENIVQIEKYLNIQQALFGYGDIDLAKELLNQVVVPSTMKKVTINPDLIDNIFKTLEVNTENQVFLPTLFENLRQIEIFGEIRQFQMTESTLIQAVEEKIIVWIQDPNNQQHANEFQVTRSALTQNIVTPSELIFLFDSMSLSISLLDALVMCESMQRKNLLDSQQISELVFWRYLGELSKMQPKEEPPQINDEIEEIADLLSHQEKNPPKQKQQLETIFNEIYRHVLSIELSQMINYSLPQSLYKIQIALISGSKSLKADSTAFNEDGNIRLMTQFTIFTKQTQDTPTVEQAIEQRLQDHSIIFILFDIKNQKIVAKGALPCEEILNIKQNSTGLRYISLFSTEEIVRLQLKVNHKTILVSLLGEDECKMISSEGQIQQTGPILSESEILKKIQPETTTNFKLSLQQIFFLRSFMSRSDLYHVEIEIQEPELKKALPDFQSDEIPTRVAQDVQHLQFDVDYDITCEELMLNQIARSGLKITVKYLFMEEVSYQLYGKLPFIGLFEDGLVEGDIPLHNDQDVLIATLSLRAEMKNQNDKNFKSLIYQDEQIIPESQSRSKYFIRILDLIVFKIDGNNELGELYFSIREPYQQSESYEVSRVQAARVNIRSCVFELSEEKSLNSIEIRSLLLGEDRLLGWFNVQTHTIINELTSEMNYLTVQTEEWAKGTTLRVGVKIIHINFDEDSLNEGSLNKILSAFQPQHMYQISLLVDRIDGDIVESVKGYLRSQLGYSYSEISFLFNLIQKDLTITLRSVFSEQIYEYDENFSRIIGNNQPHNLIFDLSEEFKFYDKFHTGFNDPKHLGTILGYFQIDSRQQNLNQYLQNFIPFNQKERIKDLGLQESRSQFDYVCFLVFLQIHLKVRPYFQDIEILHRAREPLSPQKNIEKKEISPSPYKISPHADFSYQQQIPKKQPDKISLEDTNYEFFLRDGSPRQNQKKTVEKAEFTPPKIKEAEKRQDKLPAQMIYSSSKDSSKPTLKEKTESNGTVQKLDDKVQDTYKSYEYIRRIEEIIRRNNLNIVQDELSSSDESSDGYN